MALNQNENGTWVVDHWYFDDKDLDEDGKPKRKRKQRTFKKHKDAIAYQKETLAQVQRGEYVAPSKVTVKECANAWFEKRFANNAYERATRVERQNHVQNYIIPAFGAIRVQSLSVERIEQQATEWNKRVTALVVNRVLRTLTDILGEAKRHKIIKDNPAQEAVRLKEQSKEQREIFRLTAVQISPGSD